MDANDQPIAKRRTSACKTLNEAGRWEPVPVPDDLHNDKTNEEQEARYGGTGLGGKYSLFQPSSGVDELVKAANNSAASHEHDSTNPVVGRRRSSVKEAH
jgi:hypothetical protein